MSLHPRFSFPSCLDFVYLGEKFSINIFIAARRFSREISFIGKFCVFDTATMILNGFSIYHPLLTIRFGKLSCFPFKSNSITTCCDIIHVRHKGIENSFQWTFNEVFLISFEGEKVLIAFCVKDAKVFAWRSGEEVQVVNTKAKRSLIFLLFQPDSALKSKDFFTILFFLLEVLKLFMTLKKLSQPSHHH